MKYLPTMVLVIVFPVITVAETYYVAPNGSDAGGGTMAVPFKTFRKALSLVNPGDTVLARGGTYTKDNAYVCDGYFRHVRDATECAPEETFGASPARCASPTYCMMSFSDFNGGDYRDPPFSVRSGTAEAPITVKAYPGEKPVISYERPGIEGYFPAGPPRIGIQFKRKAHFVLEGFEMIGSTIYIAGGGAHDITISKNRIHSVRMSGGSNAGLIKIDRGERGELGPYNITISGNVLHDLADVTAPETDWRTTVDAGHFGAIAAQSIEAYTQEPPGTGVYDIRFGNGRVDIVNNLIYNVTWPFFFKNPMRGPVNISRNVVFNAQGLGRLGSSNMTVHDNLFVNAVGPFNEGYYNAWGTGATLDPVASRNNRIERNTFVGSDALLLLSSGDNYVVTNNVLFGIGRSMDTQGDIPLALYTVSWDFNGLTGVRDPADPKQSVLTRMAIDNNCLIWQRAPGAVTLRHTLGEVFDLAKARSMFGLEKSSIDAGATMDAATVFVRPVSNVLTRPLQPIEDPRAGDFRIKPGHACAGKGIGASDEWLAEIAGTTVWPPSKPAPPVNLEVRP